MCFKNIIVLAFYEYYFFRRTLYGVELIFLLAFLPCDFDADQDENNTHNQVYRYLFLKNDRRKYHYQKRFEEKHHGREACAFCFKHFKVTVKCQRRNNDRDICKLQPIIFRSNFIGLIPCTSIIGMEDKLPKIAVREV